LIHFYKRFSLFEEEKDGCGSVTSWGKVD